MTGPSIILVLATLLSIGSQAPAADEVFIRTTRADDDAAWVGQRVPIYVQVVTRHQPVGATRFAVPAIDNALFVRATGSPVLGTERIDGEAYTTMRYEFMLFPRAAGDVEVPAIDVDVSVRDGDDEARHELASEPLVVPVRLPGATAGQAIVTSSDFEVSETWEPEPGRAQLGDAFTRTITVRARDVLGLALPPAPAGVPDGLRLYADDPLVDDRLERGELSGSRIETLTYVCERPGDYTLPALVYTCWNPDTGSIERTRLEPRAISVSGVVEGAATEAAPTARGVSWWLVVGVPAVLIGVILVFRRRVTSRLESIAARRAASEPMVFRRCLDACRRSDVRDAYARTRAWAQQAGVDLRRLAAWEDAQRAMVTGSAWDGRALAEALRSHRAAATPRKSAGTGASELNPV